MTSASPPTASPPVAPECAATLPSVSPAAVSLPSLSPTSSELLAAGLVGVVASIFIGAMPGIVGALTESGRLPVDEAGLVIAVDVAAQVAGAAAYLALGVPGWKLRVLIGLLLMAAGNALSCYAVGFAALAGTRVVAGFGVGAGRAACFAMLAMAGRPARAAGLFNVAQSLVIAAAFAAFPPLSAALGWRGPFLFLCALALATVAAVSFWPSAPSVAPTRSAPGRSSAVSLRFSLAEFAVLSSVTVYFVGQAALWAFLTPLGRAAGQSADRVAQIAGGALIPGALASLLASFAAGRLATRAGLLGGLASTLGSLLLLGTAARTGSFAVAVMLFYFAWSATVPFQFAAVAAIARRGSGRASGAYPTADTLGIALGPALAGEALINLGPTAVIGLAALASIAGIALLLSFSGSGTTDG